MKNKRRKKWIVILMMFSMLTTLCSCESKNTEILTDSGKEIVTLEWYMAISPIAEDTKQVIETLNVYLRDKIGVELDYHPILFSDYKEKMTTVMNAGEEYDICFTSDWLLNYNQRVKRGEFLELNSLLPEEAAQTYEQIPTQLWDAICVDGKIYGIPCYKEMGWQGGVLVNAEMAKEYGIDLSKISSLEDLEPILEQVQKKSEEKGKKVRGISGMSRGFYFANLYETMTNNRLLPGVVAVEEDGSFSEQGQVFNQYDTKEYEDYCKMSRRWYLNGYLGEDPIQYDKDNYVKENEFAQGKLFSYLFEYAPGSDLAISQTVGFEAKFIPFMKPYFETRNGSGGIMAISANSKHPKEALEFLNLLNTDQYVGTTIRHGIEGIHYTEVGENQVDKTMGGKIKPGESTYDYSYGWQFGSPFNQKWDISYPENIEELFDTYNQSAQIAKHNGFVLDTTQIEEILKNMNEEVEIYRNALESGMVDPEETLPLFRNALKEKGVEILLDNIREQLETWEILLPLK